MPDVVEQTTKNLQAWVVRVAPGHAAAFMERTVDSAVSSGAQVLVMRADMVFGLDHVRSALFHAKKAIDERRNSSDSLSMESLLYASGERQLSSAVKKMCVDLTTEEVVVARLSEGDVEADSTWRILDDKPHDISIERLKRFGINQQELDTIGSRDPGDLVLERVAAVDIIKK